MVVATGAIRYEHTSREYAPIEFPAVPDYEVTNRPGGGRQDLGYPLARRRGPVQGLLLRPAQPRTDSPVAYELQAQVGEPGSGWASWPARWSPPPFSCWPPPWGCRCGSCFHVIWNQEREAAGLDQKENEDVTLSVKLAVEAVKELIRRDRAKEGTR